MKANWAGENLTYERANARSVSITKAESEAPVFRHVVMFKWHEGVESTEVRAVAAALDRLTTVIPTINTYAHGPSAGVNADNFDYVVVADFASVDDYLIYRDHPEHHTFITTNLSGRVAARAAIQYHVADQRDC